MLNIGYPQETRASVCSFARGQMHGREVLRLTWQIVVGARIDTHDAIRIEATPPIHYQPRPEPDMALIH